MEGPIPQRKNIISPIKGGLNVLCILLASPFGQRRGVWGGSKKKGWGDGDERKGDRGDRRTDRSDQMNSFWLQNPSKRPLFANQKCPSVCTKIDELIFFPKEV